MERLYVNYVPENKQEEHHKSKLFVGGVTKLDKLINPGIDHKKLEQWNRLQLGEMDTNLALGKDGFKVYGEVELYIPYDTIEYVSLSMCTIHASFSYNRYIIDFDIITNKETYRFEIYNPKYFNDIIIKLNELHIEIIDMAGIVNLYHQYPNYDDLFTYLRMHFNEIAKKHHLDNPRTEGIGKRYLDNINMLKDMYGGNRK